MIHYDKMNMNENHWQFVIWMTGLPSAGKSTLARELKHRIPNLIVLDGDELREWLSPKDFSREGRIEHNKRVAHLARFLLNNYLPVCVALISPYAENRRDAHAIIGNKFIELYVRCELAKCEERDVKGMYKLARQGKIKNFTGIDDAYEPPTNPDITMDTDKMSLEECVDRILKTLDSRFSQ